MREKVGPEIHLHLLAPGLEVMTEEARDIVSKAVADARQRYGPDAEIFVWRLDGVEGLTRKLES